MPVYRLGPQLLFPPPQVAREDGLLAIGGDLSPARLLLAYQHGIFPWFSEGQPLLWWSPSPRMVLMTDELRVQRSLRKRIRQRPYRLSMDQAFADVVRQCASVPRAGQEGTWITAEMQRAYVRLHDLGHAHSVEAWDGDELVGGLYGIAMGRCFCGESMFAKAPDASKIAFATFVQQLRRWGVAMVDCQMHTPHLARFGAREVDRAMFLQALEVLAAAPARQGTWAFDEADGSDTPSS